MDSKKWKVRGAALDYLNRQLAMDPAALPDDFANIKGASS